MNNPLSYSSVKIDLFSRDGAHLKAASGFVVEADKRYYLITSWHVVSGKDFASQQANPGPGPYILKTSLHMYSGVGEMSTPVSMGVWKRITIPLYEDSNAPLWIEPRKNKQTQPAADVVALSIPMNDTLRFNETLRLIGSMTSGSSTRASHWIRISSIHVSAVDTHVEYGPSDQVHIVGHPHGWAPNGSDKSSTAFWRTASVASEIYETGMRRWEYTFFIDPCPPEGMTGSPVLGLKNDSLKLLGVYSDNSTAEFGANAGIVWDAWLVKELVAPS